jgi:formylmethanofuran dehydrogenase subunit D
MKDSTRAGVNGRDGQQEEFDREKLTRVEFAPPLGQPTTACRCATTRNLIARASEQSGYGWVCLNPETVSRLGLRPGDAVWLSDGGTPAPFSIESHETVEHGQAWLNPREMAAMEVQDGDKLTAASAYHETPSALEEPQASDREP